VEGEKAVWDATPAGLWLGEELRRGLPLTLRAGEPLRLLVRPYLTPPYGIGVLELSGPQAYGTAGPVEYHFTVRNLTSEPRSVRLESDWGELSLTAVELPAEGEQSVVLTGTLEADRTVTLTARPSEPWRWAKLRVHLLRDEKLVGFVDCEGETYRGETYYWTGRGPIEYTLPARPGKAHQLLLRWGAKNDLRRGKVIVNGRTFPVEHGGYDGYEWITIDLPAELITGNTLTVRLEAEEQRKGAPFVAEIRLRVP